MCSLHHLSSSSTCLSSSSPFSPHPPPLKQQMSPIQIPKFFSSSSCSYINIMADLIVGAKSFVTSLPLLPLSNYFTNICKMSAVWIGDNSSGNLSHTTQVHQHCVLSLNLGELLCGYVNTIRLLSPYKYQTCYRHTQICYYMNFSCDNIMMYLHSFKDTFRFRWYLIYSFTLPICKDHKYNMYWNCK